MIRYNPKEWYHLIFAFRKSDTLNKLFRTLLFFSIYCLIVIYLEIHYTNFKSTIAIHSLLGFVLGLLLVFRTNTAYERWWEGRKHWGALVNNTRHIASKLNAILDKDKYKNKRDYLKNMVINYPYACKNHLRDKKEAVNINFSDGNTEELINKIDHVPYYIINNIEYEINNLYKNGDITGDQLIIIDKEIKSFSDVIGACERIKNTPIPYSYNMFLKKFIFAYTLTMPFGMVTDFGYWTIPITTFTLYVLSSLEILAEEIEDPFGKDENDLPLNDLCNKIKSNVEEIMN